MSNNQLLRGRAAFEAALSRAPVRYTGVGVNRITTIREAQRKRNLVPSRYK